MELPSRHQANIQFHRRGVVIHMPGEAPKGGPRGKVRQFSAASRKRLGWAYMNGPWASMLTLTYGGASFPDGPTSKRSLAVFLQSLRRQGVAYLWVLEWQGRGWPHYHVWMDRELEPHEWRPLVETWLRAIGEDQNQKARRVGLHPASYTPWAVLPWDNYAVKYAEKQAQKGLPAGVESYGRWWGTSTRVAEPTAEIGVDLEWIDKRTGEYIKPGAAFLRQVRRALRAWRLAGGHRKGRKGPPVGLRAILTADRMKAVKRLLEAMEGVDLSHVPVEVPRARVVLG